MQKILVFLRFKQLLSHILHNYAEGPSFFADHEFLSGFYNQAETQYDTLIERIIGLKLDINPILVQEEAVTLLKEIEYPFKNPFDLLLVAEEQLCQAINDFVHSEKDLSEGTIQMLGNFCDQAEINQYKISRRIK